MDKRAYELTLESDAFNALKGDFNKLLRCCNFYKAGRSG